MISHFILGYCEKGPLEAPNYQTLWKMQNPSGVRRNQGNITVLMLAPFWLWFHSSGSKDTPNSLQLFVAAMYFRKPEPRTVILFISGPILSHHLGVSGSQCSSVQIAVFCRHFRLYSTFIHIFLFLVPAHRIATPLFCDDSKLLALVIIEISVRLFSWKNTGNKTELI